MGKDRGDGLDNSKQAKCEKLPLGSRSCLFSLCVWRNHQRVSREKQERSLSNGSLDGCNDLYVPMFSLDRLLWSASSDATVRWDNQGRVERVDEDRKEEVFDQLPLDVMRYLFSFLQPKNLGRLSMVNRDLYFLRWSDDLRSNKQWRRNSVETSNKEFSPVRSVIWWLQGMYTQWNRWRGSTRTCRVKRTQRTTGDLRTQALDSSGSSIMSPSSFQNQVRQHTEWSIIRHEMEVRVEGVC